MHRREWDAAEAKLDVAREAASDLRRCRHADLYHSGYTQDALKEVVEARHLRHHPTSRCHAGNPAR
ncbi:MAG: hypothetical protein LC121_26705 [Anaerolineae bacterium]|nr:hypothetical protein [Anaerolineae bacterium]